jgi:Holliday junction resolvase RusA-like endonuclease
MARRPLKLNIRIPQYKTPRYTWRKAIHKVVVETQRKTPVVYNKQDRLELIVRLYFGRSGKASINDVDNRLKDCLDALQGRVGGSKKKSRLRYPPIIPDDRQIWRVVVEKAVAPRQAKGRGHLTIRRLKRR